MSVYRRMKKKVNKANSLYKFVPNQLSLFHMWETA